MNVWFKHAPTYDITRGLSNFIKCEVFCKHFSSPEVCIHARIKLRRYKPNLSHWIQQRQLKYGFMTAAIVYMNFQPPQGDTWLSLYLPRLNPRCSQSEIYWCPSGRSGAPCCRPLPIYSQQNWSGSTSSWFLPPKANRGAAETFSRMRDFPKVCVPLMTLFCFIPDSKVLGSTYKNVIFL